MNVKRGFLVCSVAIAAGLPLLAAQPAAVTPGPGVRYATDAYPGFDLEDEVIKPEKKTIGWFRWWSAPKMDSSAAQLAWAEELEAGGSLGRAGRAYDALVGEWPYSPEASVAQRKLADLRAREEDYIDAVAEYRYLLDFYSAKCDYPSVAAIDYAMCEKMREQGKTIMFFRFANTVDVRRAYEALVLRAPGAPFVPDAMLTIAGLREDEDKEELAVVVYENLRNLYPNTRQARLAMHREAQARRKLLERHGYNRARIRDTIDFLKLAIRSDCTVDERKDYVAWLEQARKELDTATYMGNKFYDSRTRTRRSAINAYRLYLEDYPDGEHAEEARARLAQLEATASPTDPGSGPAAIAAQPNRTADAPTQAVVQPVPKPAENSPVITTDMTIAAPAYAFDPEAPYTDPQAVDTTEGEPYWLTEYMEERERREEEALQRAKEENKPKWYYLWLSK